MPFHLARLFFSDFLHSPIPCLSETHRTLLSSFSHILVTKICSENNLWSLPKTECLPREITPFSSIVSKNVSVWSSALYIHPFLKSIRSALSCYKSNQLPISGIGLKLIWKGGGGGGRFRGVMDEMENSIEFLSGTRGLRFLLAGKHERRVVYTVFVFTIIPLLHLRKIQKSEAYTRTFRPCVFVFAFFFFVFFYIYSRWYPFLLTVALHIRWM